MHFKKGVASMSNKIYLKNMVFYGFHGHFEFERELGQRFYVDLEVTTTNFAKASASDDLADAIDYVALYSKTKDIVENNRCKLIESLVTKVADEILKLCASATEVKVNIRKPSVPINGALDCVEIEIVKKR
jgi:dihydroneopterin aldolase